METEQKQKYNWGEKCVCVGRVSTTSQSQTAQVEDLKKFAKELGFSSVQPFFTTESGFLEYDNKTGWNLVTQFFETHPDYKVLICPEISRLSRKKSILHRIEEYLIEHKIQLIIKDINFTLYNEWGEVPEGNGLVFSLFASLAESEMRSKKERFRRVLEDNRRMGYSIGGKRLFGYDRYYERKDGKERSRYRINEVEADQIRTIYKWYAFGIDGDVSKTSVNEITRKCIEEGFHHYLHSKRNVNKTLKERAYIGQKETHNRVHNAEYWSYRDTSKPKYIEGKSYICSYPPIFDEEGVALFEKVQQRLQENNSKINKEGVPVDKSTQHITILSKLIKCPNCGHYLNGEYRAVKQNKRRQHLGTRYYYTYRCHYSRGVINQCSFKHVLSMPLMDSVVWAYCRQAVLFLLESEERNNIDEQINELDKKILNIEERIKTFNFEDRIKGEETILRSKLIMLSGNEARQAAVADYEHHIEAINKELHSYENRILELDREKEDLKNSKKLISSLAERHNISSNKHQLYRYIHKIVDHIEIVFCNREFTVMRVYMKKYLNPCRPDEYVCLHKRSTRDITSLVIHPVDLDLARIALNPQETVKDWNRKIQSLPSQDNLNWVADNGVFEIEGVQFSLDELFRYDKDPMEYHKLTSVEHGKQVDISQLPVYIKRLEVERLNCYDEDKKE